MLIQIVRETLIGARTYSEGDRVELGNALAARHLKAGTAVIALDLGEGDDDDRLETAVAPAPIEAAEAAPGKRRRA